ncbi:MAG: cytochrome b/b6 domain-containing protein [Nitrososphaerota archaeon]|nr:cytochrome b/b6 domain-containing protein [Nitrososphaerota archaeon]
MREEEYLKRWHALDRLTHLLILLGVLIGIISGLPELQLNIFGYNLGNSFRWITDYIGGEAVRRLLHRYVLTILVGVAIVLHTLSFGLRSKKSNILFTYKDLRDLISYYKFRFLKTPEPELGFHMPGEKLLYWIAGISLPILGATGIVMWTNALPAGYEILRLLHRIFFILLTVFVIIHFILNIVLRDQWPALKAMFLTGKVPSVWVRKHHPKTFEEEKTVWVGRRKAIKTLLTIIPAVALGYALSELLKPPTYSIRNIYVEPPKVKAGDPFTVYVEVTNVGYRDGTFNVQLFIDGNLVDERSVALLDGETKLLSFQATLKEVGTHTITVDNLSTSVEVTEAPPPIAPELAEKFRKLLPEAYGFVPIVKEGKIAYYEIYDKTGNLIAYGFYTRAYAPTDRLQIIGIVGLDYKIKSIDVDRIEPGTKLHNESIIESEFEDRFIGLTVDEVKPSPEGKVDAISGATISSVAVIDAVRNALNSILQR